MINFLSMSGAHTKARKPGQIKNEIGHTYGRLTVIGTPDTLPRRGRAMRWKCRCTCGNIFEVEGSRLRLGNAQSCGCIAREKTKPMKEVARARLWKAYSKDATRRGHAWKLSPEGFTSMLEQPCHYCAAPPSQIIRRREEVFLYNGIDRVENSLGYLPNNCVPCCWKCNHAKADMPIEEFEAWMDRIIQKRSLVSP